MTMSQISWKRWVAFLAVLAIGIPAVGLLFGSDAYGAVPTTRSAQVVTVDSTGPEKDDTSPTPAPSNQVQVAPWTLRPRPGPDCGYLNPYTGNMGSCLLQRHDFQLTRTDRRIFVCAGQGAIAASATLILGPAAVPAAVAGASAAVLLRWGLRRRRPGVTGRSSQNRLFRTHSMRAPHAGSARPDVLASSTG